VRVLITGSREVDPIAEAMVCGVLDEIDDVLLQRGIAEWTLVHGAARGVDTVAAFWGAGTEGVTLEPHAADWSVGKVAGHRRNAAMVERGAEICLAFPRPDSRGTWDCARRAADAGIHVRIYPLGALA